MAVRKNTRRECVVILRCDDALDDKTEADIDTAYEAYCKSGFDERHLQFKPGATPTRFRLRRLSHNARAYSEELGGTPLSQSKTGVNMAWCTFVVRCGLAGLSGYWVETEDGEGHALKPPDFTSHEEYGPMVTEQWMREADLPLRDLVALATRIKQLSESNVPFVKRSGTPCTDGASSPPDQTSPASTNGP